MIKTLCFNRLKLKNRKAQKLTEDIYSGWTMDEYTTMIRLIHSHPKASNTKLVKEFKRLKPKSKHQRDFLFAKIYQISPARKIKAEKISAKSRNHRKTVIKAPPEPVRETEFEEYITLLEAQRIFGKSQIVLGQYARANKLPVNRDDGKMKVSIVHMDILMDSIKHGKVDWNYFNDQLEEMGELAYA